jgi:holin-like protein
MKYLSQFLIILGFTFLGEALQRLLPLPIPASVWGLALLFLALCMKLIRVEQVKEAGGFLTSILPILFVAPAVGIAENWGLIAPRLLPILLLLLSSTVLTFGIAGKITGLFMKKGGEGRE